MTQLNALNAASIVAEANANPEGGGGLPFDPFLLLMLAVFAILIFSMFRRNKKTQQQQQQLHSSLGPGIEVMTTMGLFGTIVSVDKEENKAVIELSPGNTATVHLQAIGKAVDPVAESDAETGAEADALADGSTVPDSPAGLDDTGYNGRNDATDSDGPEDPRPGDGRPSA
ncbi:preprotein translocase subunit YajC [Citricoccus sp. GCM10030269]|uniref:preprotein translocase subunit YajC n=1 Tax=Citricoccus sp. GCM10030269 TaxID=3273388 RepID=UPI0036185746